MYRYDEFDAQFVRERAEQFRGQVARRRTTHFGWPSGYETWRIEPGPPIPDFLLALRARAAAVAAVAAEDLVEVLVTHYPPGAGIGWHRDAPMFGSPVVGISLSSACVMKLRKKLGEGFAQSLAPRSLYLLGGAARTQWQHSIPPTKDLRYSVTMRTLSRRR